MKVGMPAPKNAPKSDARGRPQSGGWRTQSRDSGGVSAATVERARQTTGNYVRPTTGSHRRTSSLPRRLILGRLVRGSALLGLAGLAAVGVIQVASWVEHGNALPVRTVAVRASSLTPASPGSSTTNADVTKERADEILAYADVKKGAPLFAVDVDAVAKRVLEHPFVSSATVRRVPPDGIEIAVTQRSPVAALSTNDALYLVDDKGTVMKAARAGDGLDLPVITGVNADDVVTGAATDTLAHATALVAAHNAAGAPGGTASEVHVKDGVGLELVLDDGSRVLVGVDGIAANSFGAKMLRLDAVERGLKASNRSAMFIDLDDDRRPERAAIRLRPVAEMQPAGGKKRTSRERG